MNYTGFSDISNDNSLIAFSHDADIIIYNKYGSVIFKIENYKLPVDETFYPVDFSVVGWDKISQHLWFYIYSDSYIVSYGRIDLLRNAYEILQRPNSFASNEIEINFNTGDVIYSDYPFQYDDIQYEQTKKSGKIFHLLKNNFFKPNETIISSNRGKGFDIIKDKNEHLYYKKDSLFFYSKVQ